VDAGVHHAGRAAPDVRPGGALDRALDKDQKNLLDTSRAGSSYEKFCEGGRQNTELCRWALENPEEAAALLSEEEE
jgi:hypothetical protein